ncbi:hypothetical protein [Brachyspira aalborgi]|nr:hypothetical protein [Brachyspira aalborgi]
MEWQFSNRYNFNEYYSVKDNIFDINIGRNFKLIGKLKRVKKLN